MDGESKIKREFPSRNGIPNWSRHKRDQERRLDEGGQTQEKTGKWCEERGGEGREGW